jgi:hypothetical protein
MKVYLAPGEKLPDRRLKNKHHIEKVMFLCAVCRPQLNENDEVVFDGKIGLWPFVETVFAKRSSKQRPKGTPITIALNVNYNIYLNYVIEKVIPAIKSKFPRHHQPCVKVLLQHDNSPCHFTSSEPRFIDASSYTSDTQRWEFDLCPQPPNSPDMNVLDLGFFASLQAEQWKNPPRFKIDDLINDVMKAWNGYNPSKLDKVFLTHQACMDKCISKYGDNNYRIPHLGKDKFKSVKEVLNVSNKSKEVLCEMGLLE